MKLRVGDCMAGKHTAWRTVVIVRIERYGSQGRTARRTRVAGPGPRDFTKAPMARTEASRIGTLTRYRLALNLRSSELGVYSYSPGNFHRELPSTGFE